jgi:Zn-dependent M16 (insulinase) family peptidase
MSTFLHGGDPLAGLRINAMVERLRAEMAADPEFWQKVIRERFVENKHRVTLHMTPDAEVRPKPPLPPLHGTL